jgi:hypothetical protein
MRMRKRERKKIKKKGEETKERNIMRLTIEQNFFVGVSK